MGKTYDYEKRWVTLGKILESEMYSKGNPIQFRSTVIKDVLSFMVAIAEAERRIRNIREGEGVSDE